MCLDDWLASNPDWTTRILAVNSIITMYTDIHQMGICHVDIKPDHIFVAKDGVRVRIIDFNYSVVKGMYENPSWTLPYIAPEIQNKNIDWEKWDLFVLGLIMIYILTGYEYSTSDSVWRLIHCFKKELKHWIQDIMEKTKYDHCVDISFLLRINPADRHVIIHKRV